MNNVTNNKMNNNMNNKKRILAISDIHGHYDELVRLLELSNYNSNEDQLVLLGDLVDRGSQNMKTLFYVRELEKDGAIVLMGNHDSAAHLSMNELLTTGYGIETKTHVNCINGYETYNEFIKLSDVNQKIARNFLKSRPLYYEYDKYIFVHSGVSPDRPLNENNEDVLLWSREEFYEFKAYENKIIIFGHTPVKYLNKNNENRVWFDRIHNDKIGIDCGCFFSKILGCLEIDLETGRYDTYYVKGD